VSIGCSRRCQQESLSRCGLCERLCEQYRIMVGVGGARFVGNPQIVSVLLALSPVQMQSARIAERGSDIA
jgi:hypothetical protein